MKTWILGIISTILFIITYIIHFIDIYSAFLLFLCMVSFFVSVFIWLYFLYAMLMDTRNKMYLDLAKDDFNFLNSDHSFRVILTYLNTKKYDEKELDDALEDFKISDMDKVLANKGIRRLKDRLADFYVAKKGIRLKENFFWDYKEELPTWKLSILLMLFCIGNVVALILLMVNNFSDSTTLMLLLFTSIISFGLSIFRVYKYFNISIFN